MHSIKITTIATIDLTLITLDQRRDVVRVIREGCVHTSKAVPQEGHYPTLTLTVI